MRHKVLVALSFSVLFSLQLFGGGKSTFDFLRNDLPARSAALGGSFVTITDDPNAIFYNPAALATLSRQKISFGFFKHLVDINSGYASFATEIPSLGFVGAGVRYINYGEFRGRGEEGQDIGTFGAGELAVDIGYGGIVHEGVRYGASAKVIYSSIGDYNAAGAAVDFGVQYDAVPQRLVLGASVLNLGTQLDQYLSTTESLPLDVLIGASIYPEHLPAALVVNLHKLNEQQDAFFDRLKAFSIGIEFTPSTQVKLRAGFNNERRQELKLGSSAGFAGMSFGAGFATEMYLFDYAFNSYGKIGGQHRISVGLGI